MKHYVIKRVLSIALASSMLVIGANAVVPKAMEVQQDTQSQKLSVSETDDAVSNVKANNYNLPDKVEGGVILHAWCWSAKTIISQLPDIAASGYTAIQTSPCNEIIPSEGPGMDKWWTQYQPTKLEIGNYMVGSKEDFTELCTKAHEYGIKIIVDVVPNHTADYCHDSQIDPALKQYWRGNRTPIREYNDRYDCTQNDVCNSLADMNTENKDYQKMYIEYLNKLIACGCDGFRYDTAKHIAVPEDAQSGCGSDFWPTVTGSAVNDINNKFVYAEVLQDSHVMYDSYAKYLRLTGNYYSATIRDKLRNGGTMDVNQISGYNSMGVANDRLVIWAESHDTFANNPSDDSYNESSWASQANIRMVWAFITARKDCTCLFYARPKGADGNHNRFPGQNNIGEVGSTEFKAPEVAAVNNFRNAMMGESEYLRNANGNTKIAMVERGKKGVVVINLGGATDLSSETTLTDGKYTDQVSGREFTVAGGKISGKLDEYKVAVIYNAKPSTASNVSASVADGSSFSTDSLNVTLNCNNCTKATYSIGGGDKTEFKDGEKIEIGKDASVGDKITLKLSGTGAEGDADATYTYTKKDPNASNVAYLKLPSGWDKAYAYVYDKSTKGSENKAWPGVAMTEVSDGLYKYEYSDTDNGFVTPLIIFNDGGAGVANKKYPADTADKVDADGLKCDGSMICDGTSWEEYVDPNKPDKPGDKKDLAVSLSADKSDIKLKSSVKLTAKASGGSGKYTYIFKEGDNEISSGADTSYEWTPEAVGDYKVTVEVNDGTKTIESSEVKVSVTDGSGDDTKELSVSLDADNTDIELNSSVKLTAKASGGSGKYTYTFKADGDKIYSGDKSSYDWTPEKAGDYKVTVEVNDGKTTEKSDEVKVGVSEGSTDTKALSASLSSDKSGDQAVNTKIKLTAKATGGSGKYTYTFKINDKKIDNGDSAIYTWTPTASGKYTVSVIVNDGEKTKTSTVKTFNITAGSTEEPSEISIDSFKLSKTKDLKVSDTVKLTAEASGGEGDLEYYFFAKKDGSKIDISKYSSKKSVSWELPAEGTYDLYVYVKDSNGIIEKIEDSIEIKVSVSGNDDETPKEGDSNNLASVLLIGIFGTSLLGILRRKKNI